MDPRPDVHGPVRHVPVPLLHVQPDQWLLGRPEADPAEVPHAAGERGTSLHI